MYAEIRIHGSAVTYIDKETTSTKVFSDPAAAAVVYERCCGAALLELMKSDQENRRHAADNHPSTGR